MDAAHIQREISEASDRVGTLSEEMAKRTEALRQKTDQADQLAVGAGGDEAAAAKHREEAGRIQRTVQTESLRLERARSQLQVALRLLPEPYRDPASTESYPSDQVLLQTGQLAGNLEAARRECQRLESILGQVRLLEQQVREALSREETIVNRYPGEDLKALVLEHGQLLGRVGELEAAEVLAEQGLEKTQAAFRRAKAAADIARGKRQGLLERAASLEVDAAAAEKVAQALVATVERGWPEADAIDRPQLASLRGRCQRLRKAAELKADLDRAREDHAEYPHEVKRLQGEIDRIPEEDRIPVARAEARVQEARSELTALEKQEREATARARGLSQRFGQQAKYKRELQRASAKRQDYSWLARAFGKSGLQSWLVKEALVAIGFAANDYLGNISEGCLRLDIKPNDDDLEILVTDFSSGQEALDVEFISGSQRFRTSVALALAIGQYSGGGSRSIRSVIIDEGFGSLDKDGRVEMIEQLKGLSGVLDKVILVSHQEEFHDAFPRGYHIVKENGASRVLLRAEGE